MTVVNDHDIHFGSILLVDDDADANFLQERAVRKAGVTNRIYVAADGEQAINLFRQLLADGEDVPEVIFLDLHMPRMNGWEFLESFQQFPAEDRKRTRVIVLSSTINREEIARAHSYPDVFDFCPKLLSTQKLVGLIEKMVNEGSDEERE